ncbi:hypothetical protein [Streptomyces sp. NPDC052042]|uniref:hypothetical protein n=1 Tax=Streptomyces sp. NPDC052042 TaxID=3365683 RepID=UPI0037D5479C
MSSAFTAAGLADRLDQDWTQHARGRTAVQEKEADQHTPQKRQFLIGIHRRTQHPAQKANVTAFVVRRCVDRGLLADRSMVRLGRVRSPQSTEVRFGTSRAGAVDVALCTTPVDAVVDARPEADREQLRAVEKGRRSPLAAPAKHASPA